MGRFNKATEGVFSEMVGNDKTVSLYEKFINYGKDLKIGKELQKFTQEYQSIIDENKTNFERLSRLEEIIMQLRSIENISDVKLSLVREYIYARCPFFRLGRDSKDIRVIVGTTDLNGQKLDKLVDNQDFMEKAYDKLRVAMKFEVDNNISDYKKIFQ